MKRLTVYTYAESKTSLFPRAGPVIEISVSQLARAIGAVQRDIGSGIAEEPVDCVHIGRE